jgi:hypothetical protein
MFRPPHNVLELMAVLCQSRPDRPLIRDSDNFTAGDCFALKPSLFCRMKQDRTAPEQNRDSGLNPKPTTDKEREEKMLEDKRKKAAKDKVEVTIAPTTKTGPDISLG